MKKIWDYLRNLLEGKNKKKLVENAAIVVIIGVIAIIAGGTIFGGSKEENTAGQGKEKEAAQTLGMAAQADEKNEVEKRIEAILAQIEGAGKVDVMVTYVSGKEVVPAYDTKKSENDTSEKDNTGGTRNINQNDYENKIAYEEGAGTGKKPIILKEVLPEVRGVVVVAEGAGNIEVKEKLSKAVQVLLDVPIHRIQVFEKGR